MKRTDKLLASSLFIRHSTSYLHDYGSTSLLELKLGGMVCCGERPGYDVYIIQL